MTKPKILFYDIETAPLLCWTWRIGTKVTLTHDSLYDALPSGIICVCYKWANEKKIHSIDWGKSQDSSKVVEEFDKVYKEADIAIAHNGDKFDARHLNTQRLINGLPPLNWVQSEDTLKQVRKHFMLPSYTLDYLSKLLLGEGKSPMQFKDWVKIVTENDQKCLKKMIKYCKRDVKLLSEVEKIIGPYVDHKVHKGIVAGKTRDECPNCASSKIQKYGVYITKTGKYQKFKCTSCGHNFKDTRQIK